MFYVIFLFNKCCMFAKKILFHLNQVIKIEMFYKIFIVIL